MTKISLVFDSFLTHSLHSCQEGSGRQALANGSIVDYLPLATSLLQWICNFVETLATLHGTTGLLSLMALPT